MAGIVNWLRNKLLLLFAGKDTVVINAKIVRGNDGSCRLILHGNALVVNNWLEAVLKETQQREGAMKRYYLFVHPGDMRLRWTGQGKLDHVSRIAITTRSMLAVMD